MVSVRETKKENLDVSAAMWRMFMSVTLRSACVNICEHTSVVLVLCIFCTCRAFCCLEVFPSRCSQCQVFMCTVVFLPQGPLSLCLRSFL